MNDPASRFCVACGAPLVGRSPAPAQPAPGPTAPPPGVPPSAPPPAYAPGRMRPESPPVGGHAVIRPEQGPPSSSLPFAETASPPSGAEFDAKRAAVDAVVAAEAAVFARQSAPPAAYRSSAPPGEAPQLGVVGATAAMPGVAQDPDLIPEGAPRHLAGFLVSYDTQPLGRFWPIFQGKNRIGRQGAGAGLDVELDHPTASSRHALVVASACPGRMKIEDTGSTNGTLINGARIAPGARHELQDGDRVRFGLLSTIVKIV